MAAAGWYPDPGGQQGMYRYFDGTRWTADLATHAGAPHPGAGAPTIPSAGPAQKRMGRPAPQNSWAKGSGPGWWIALSVIAVFVVVALIVGLRTVFGGGLSPDGPAGTTRPPQEVGCPEATVGLESPPAMSSGRVVAGKISYPALGQPFGSPQWDTRVPFGREVRSQHAAVEEGADGRPLWVAAALIAKLTAGDGFYDPQRGAERVADCVISKFYGDAAVQREDVVNDAITIDGVSAWKIESTLSFQVPEVRTTGETMIIVVVDTGNSESGLFYGSIPNTSPQFERPIRQALAELKVDR